MRVGSVLGGNSVGVKALTLAVSVSAHAAFALVAAHGGSEGTATGAPARRDELPAPELVVVEAPTNATSNGEPSARGGPRSSHTHPYPVSADHDATPHDPSLPHLPLSGRSVDRPLAPASVTEPSSIAPARFVLTIGASSSETHGAAGSGAASDAPPAAAVLTEDGVDRAATLITGSAPAYTREAEVAGVEADVPLEIVVDDRGNVVSARGLRRVGYGLDEVALRGIQDYRFAPARRSGHPVAVRMRWVVRFELR